MSTKLFQVDAFASEAFTGNPAGVCLLETAKPETWMQNVAMEMNVSETAFLVLRDHGYHLRWFTPAAEVDLCGHATLASAHILNELGRVADGQKIEFHTASGLLTARIKANLIELDFPVETPELIDPSPQLAATTDDRAQAVFKNRMDFFAVLGSEEEVRAFQPDSAQIRKLGTRGLVITAKASMLDFDFVSRYFAPSFGIEEDPVTGSTHCSLTPYWARVMKKKSLKAAQLSERGGVLYVEDLGDRVSIGGQAITTMKIDLLV